MEQHWITHWEPKALPETLQLQLSIVDDYAQLWGTDGTESYMLAQDLGVDFIAAFLHKFGYCEISGRTWDAGVVTGGTASRSDVQWILEHANRPWCAFLDEVVELTVGRKEYVAGKPVVVLTASGTAKRWEFPEETESEAQDLISMFPPCVSREWLVELHDLPLSQTIKEYLTPLIQGQAAEGMSIGDVVLTSNGRGWNRYAVTEVGKTYKAQFSSAGTLSVPKWLWDHGEPMKIPVALGKAFQSGNFDLFRAWLIAVATTKALGSKAGAATFTSSALHSKCFWEATQAKRYGQEQWGRAEYLKAFREKHDPRAPSSARATVDHAIHVGDCVRVGCYNLGVVDVREDDGLYHYTAKLGATINEHGIKDTHEPLCNDKCPPPDWLFRSAGEQAAELWMAAKTAAMESDLDEAYVAERMLELKPHIAVTIDTDNTTDRGSAYDPVAVQQALDSEMLVFYAWALNNPEILDHPVGLLFEAISQGALTARFTEALAKLSQAVHATRQLSSFMGRCTVGDGYLWVERGDDGVSMEVEVTDDGDVVWSAHVSGRPDYASAVVELTARMGLPALAEQVIAVETRSRSTARGVTVGPSKVTLRPERHDQWDPWGGG